MIGSNIIGHLASLSAYAVALIVGLLWITPIFTALGGVSSNILKTWSETRLGAIGTTSLIFRVFCAVIAVTTVQA